MNCDMSANLYQFTKHMPSGAGVVDAGCESGRDTAWFLAAIRDAQAQV
jgi:hypothetical protein